MGASLGLWESTQTARHYRLAIEDTACVNPCENTTEAIAVVTYLILWYRLAAEDNVEGHSVDENSVLTCCYRCCLLITCSIR